MSQSFILPDFPEIAKRKIERYPGGYSKVAKALNIGRAALYDKVKRRTEFKASELAALDALLSFTEEEKATIWR